MMLEIMMMNDSGDGDYGVNASEDDDHYGLNNNDDKACAVNDSA